MHQVLLHPHFELVVEQFAQQLNGQVLLRHALTSARNSSDRMEISGFFRPAAAKMSMTWSLAATARERIWRMAWSMSSAASFAIHGGLDQRGADGLEEGDIVPDGEGALVRDGQGKGQR